MNFKTLLSTVVISALGLAAFGCSDDDDGISVNNVPQKVQQTMSQMFPGHRDVSWDKVPPYYVAEFMHSGFDTEAWFGADGNWAMTDVDYDTNTSYLPLPVQEAFSMSPYAQWIVDDVHSYSRTLDAFYVIEVENNASPDISLFYSDDGVLLNEVQDFDITITPNTVIAAL